MDIANKLENLRSLDRSLEINKVRINRHHRRMIGPIIYNRIVDILDLIRLEPIKENPIFPPTVVFPWEDF